MVTLNVFTGICSGGLSEIPPSLEGGGERKTPEKIVASKTRFKGKFKSSYGVTVQNFCQPKEIWDVLFGENWLNGANKMNSDVEKVFFF